MDVILRIKDHEDSGTIRYSYIFHESVSVMLESFGDRFFEYIGMITAIKKVIVILS